MMDNKGSRWNIWENMVMICEDHWLKLIAGCWNVLLRPVPSWRQEWHLYGFNITAVYCCNHRDLIFDAISIWHHMTRFFRETDCESSWDVHGCGTWCFLAHRAARTSLCKAFMEGCCPESAETCRLTGMNLFLWCWAAKTGKMLGCTTIKIGVEPMKIVFKMV